MSMKINGRDYVLVPVKAAGLAGAAVVLEVRAYGFPLANETIKPAEARLLAAQLVAAADQAEGIR